MSELIAEVFRFCPRCGQAAESVGANPFRCGACDYTHFFSPCVAVGGIFRDDRGRVMFLHRQNDPGKGKLGLPGGFVDAGETVEEAMRREAMEEINLQISKMQYLVSFPNNYNFRGVTVPVTDFFFVCEVESYDGIAVQESEVSDWHFCHPDESTLRDMAFESNRKAMRVFLQQYPC